MPRNKKKALRVGLIGPKDHRRGKAGARVLGRPVSSHKLEPWPDGWFSGRVFFADDQKPKSAFFFQVRLIND